MIDHKISFTHQDCEVIDRHVVHEGIFRYVQYHLRHRLFNGAWTPVLSRELVERTSAAGVLPYDPILDQVVLISQFRPGAITKNAVTSPWLLEIVAGVLGKNEKPDEVAIRESYEEAGCRILELCLINEYFVSPGGSDEYLSLYCGRVDASHITGYYGLEEEHEDIYAFALPVEEAFALLKQGKIKTSPAIIALQWLQINHASLRNLWLKK